MKIELKFLINKIFNNKKWIGEGKEYYDDGKLKFEGEYINGEKNGKGIEYDISSKTILFEGEYLNGKRNGKGKEYNYKHELKYEWNWKYKIRN